jgi:hypothetical protein
MEWQAFVHEDKNYDLSHLRSVTIVYEQPAKGGKAARKYEVEVEFSCHCFTRGLPGEGSVDDKLLYGDERRIFDFQRYELSKLLPGIVEQLPHRECFHADTRQDNFFSLEQQNGEATYEIYFKADRVGKGRLKLFVQSAYLRDKQHDSRPRSYKIGFFVILYNTLHQKPIKVGRG